jgi:hypothetical protein
MMLKHTHKICGKYEYNEIKFVSHKKHVSVK